MPLKNSIPVLPSTILMRFLTRKEYTGTVNAVTHSGVVCAYKKHSETSAFPLKKMITNLTVLSFWKVLGGMDRRYLPVADSVVAKYATAHVGVALILLQPRCSLFRLKRLRLIAHLQALYQYLLFPVRC